MEQPSTLNSAARIDELAHRPVGRLLWEYSLPAVVGMLVMALYNVVDRVFIGRWVGPDAISGLAITFPLMNLATAIGVLVGVGSCTRVSIDLGRGCPDRACRVLGNALTLTFINAAAYIAAFAAFMDPLLRAFGASAATLPYARAYMMALLPGLLLTNVAFGLNNIMRSSGYPRRAMYTMLIGAAVNVGLDPIFIYMFDWGIAGAAWATNIAMAVSSVYVLKHFFRRDVTVRFRRGTFGLSWRIVLSIVSIGAAPALVNAASCFINALINNTLAHYGSDSDIGAAGIMVTYTSVLVTIVLGISQGMQPIVGYNYGAGNYGRLRQAFLLAIGAASAVTLLGEAFGLACPQLIAHAFTTDSTLTAATVRALHRCLLIFGVVGFQVLSTSFFQSIGCATKAIIVSLLRQVTFLIPLLYILPRYMGLNGVWVSFPVSDFLATVVTWAMVSYQLREITFSQNKS